MFIAGCIYSRDPIPMPTPIPNLKRTGAGQRGINTKTANIALIFRWTEGPNKAAFPDGFVKGS
jgi:hypothetical protein